MIKYFTRVKFVIKYSFNCERIYSVGSLRYLQHKFQNKYQNSQNYGGSQNTPSGAVTTTVNKEHKGSQIWQNCKAKNIDQLFCFNQKVQVFRETVMPKPEDIIQEKREDGSYKPYNQPVPYFVEEQRSVIDMHNLRISIFAFEERPNRL
jgi:hypothetical protein